MGNVRLHICLWDHFVQTEDRQLLSMVRGKFDQLDERLRQMFRHMDTNKNSLIGGTVGWWGHKQRLYGVDHVHFQIDHSRASAEKDEFVKAVQLLCSSIDEAQVERIFGLIDTEGKGAIDYDGFVAKFGAVDVLSQPKVGGGQRWGPG